MLEKEELISNFIKNELNDVPNVLSRDLSKNNKKLNPRDELSELKGYADTFLNEDTSNKIVVLPGLRGVGKTTLILQLYEYLMKEKNIPPRNILYISFDDLKFPLNTIRSASSFAYDHIFMLLPCFAKYMPKAVPQLPLPIIAIFFILTSLLMAIVFH